MQSFYNSSAFRQCATIMQKRRGFKMLLPMIIDEYRTRQLSLKFRKVVREQSSQFILNTVACFTAILHIHKSLFYIAYSIHIHICSLSSMNRIENMQCNWKYSIFDAVLRLSFISVYVKSVAACSIGRHAKYT